MDIIPSPGSQCHAHSGQSDLCDSACRSVAAQLSGYPRFSLAAACRAIAAGNPEMREWILRADSEELRSRTEFYPRPVGFRLFPVAGE